MVALAVKVSLVFWLVCALEWHILTTTSTTTSNWTPPQPSSSSSSSSSLLNLQSLSSSSSSSSLTKTRTRSAPSPPLGKATTSPAVAKKGARSAAVAAAAAAAALLRKTGKHFKEQQHANFMNEQRRRLRHFDNFAQHPIVGSWNSSSSSLSLLPLQPHEPLAAQAPLCHVVYLSTHHPPKRTSTSKKAPSVHEYLTQSSTPSNDDDDDDDSKSNNNYDQEKDWLWTGLQQSPFVHLMEDDFSRRRDGGVDRSWEPNTNTTLVYIVDWASFQYNCHWLQDQAQRHWNRNSSTPHDDAARRYASVVWVYWDTSETWHNGTALACSPSRLRPPPPFRSSSSSIRTTVRFVQQALVTDRVWNPTRQWIEAGQIVVPNHDNENDDHNDTPLYAPPVVSDLFLQHVQKAIRSNSSAHKKHHPHSLNASESQAAATAAERLLVTNSIHPTPPERVISALPTKPNTKHHTKSRYWKQALVERHRPIDVLVLVPGTISSSSSATSWTNHHPHPHDDSHHDEEEDAPSQQPDILHQLGGSRAHYSFLRRHVARQLRHFNQTLARAIVAAASHLHHHNNATTTTTTTTSRHSYPIPSSLQIQVAVTSHSARTQQVTMADHTDHDPAHEAHKGQEAIPTTSLASSSSSSSSDNRSHAPTTTATTPACPVHDLLRSKIALLVQSDEWEGPPCLMEAMASGAVVLMDVMLAPPRGIQNGTNVWTFASDSGFQQALKHLLLVPSTVPSAASSSPQQHQGGGGSSSRSTLVVSPEQRRWTLARAAVDLVWSKHRAVHRVEQILFGRILSDTKTTTRPT
ncbi:hypothetical protein ACA910_010437 [Epithemia clementina (nom. ined.)]